RPDPIRWFLQAVPIRLPKRWSLRSSPNSPFLRRISRNSDRLRRSLSQIRFPYADFTVTPEKISLSTEAAMCNMEMVRALRGTKDDILRDWQAEAKVRLWHLDSQLFTRKGAASQCLTATLSDLIAFFQVSRPSLPAPDPPSGSISQQN